MYVVYNDAKYFRTKAVHLLLREHFSKITSTSYVFVPKKIKIVKLESKNGEQNIKEKNEN